MSNLHLATISMIVKLQLPKKQLQQYLPASVDELGVSIAEQVDLYVQNNNLGYYPAVGYFRSNSGIADYLLNALDDVTELSQRVAGHEVHSILSGVFSSVRINNMQAVAYTMPTVRPGQENTTSLLIKHVTPNVVKFELLVTLFQKEPPLKGLEDSVKKMVLRWLEDKFDNVNVTAQRLISNYSGNSSTMSE